MRVTVVTLLLLALAGCATPDFNYVPKMQSFSEPDLGAVATAYVGDSMVRQGTYTEHEAIKVLEELRLGLFDEYTVSKGYFLKRGVNKNYETFTSPMTPDAGTITSAPLSDPVLAIIVYRGSSKLCALTV